MKKRRMVDKNNVIHDKAYAFAIRVVNAYRFLCDSQKEYVLSRQMLRSGTAIGALVAEAHHAQSGADFLNKMNVALKEANETSYWLSLLKDTHYLDIKSYDSMAQDCSEIIALLVSIVKSMKANLGK